LENPQLTIVLDMVLKVQGTVEEKFSKFDTDGNGSIDSSELQQLMVSLGCKDITEVSNVLDDFMSLHSYL